MLYVNLFADGGALLQCDPQGDASIPVRLTQEARPRRRRDLPALRRGPAPNSTSSNLKVTSFRLSKVLMSSIISVISACGEGGRSRQARRSLLPPHACMGQGRC
jgi:hypothetical protein